MPQRDERGARVWALAVLAVGLCAAWPFARCGFPWNTDDVQWHAIWTRQFLAEMQAGAWYPRWLAGMNDGQGSPTFFFYAPLSYWATSVASLLSGAADPEAWPFQAMSAVSTAALCGSGLSAFLWLRRLAGPAEAAAGAALYVVAPYHLLVDVWTRSSFAEANAYVWTPLLFLGIEQVRAGRRAGMLVLAASYALLLSTHIITGMLAGLVAGFYALLRFRSAGALVAMAAAMLLGVGLAGAYLAPALVQKDLTEHTVGVLDAGLFFPMTNESINRPQLVRVLTLLWLAEAAAAAAFLAMGLIVTRGPRRAVWLAWAGVLAFVLVAMARPAMPTWNAVSVLQNAQFPSRLFALADVALASLAALTLAALVTDRGRTGFCAGLMLALAAFGATEALPPIHAGAFDKNLANWRAEWEVQGDHGFFRPLTSHRTLPQDRRPPERVTDPIVAVPGGSARIADVAPRRYVVEVDTPAPSVLRLRQLGFIGWHAVADGQTLPLRPGRTGLVEVDVPAGRHLVVVSLTATPSEQAGWAISALAVVAWLGLAGWVWRDPRLAPHGGVV